VANGSGWTATTLIISPCARELFRAALLDDYGEPNRRYLENGMKVQVSVYGARIGDQAQDAEGSSRIPHITSISHHQLRRPHLLKCGRIVVYVSILVAAFQGIALSAGLEMYPTDFGTASAGQACYSAGRLDRGVESSWDDSTGPIN